MSQSRDVAMRMSYGELAVQVIAEGVAWSPDVADDMVRRTSELWCNAVANLAAYGIFEMPDADEELTEEELAELMQAPGEAKGDETGGE